MNPRKPLLFAILATLLALSRAHALVMTDHGPELIMVEVKSSLRLTSELDSDLQALAATESQSQLTVVTRFVGAKYLELVSFPTQFTEDQALAAIDVLVQQPYVEAVLPTSVSWLIYPSLDQAYAPGDTIPEYVLRGLISEPTPPFDPSVVLRPHANNELIVGWKPQFIWNAAQTGFDQQMKQFNAAQGCRVVGESNRTDTELTQILEFSGPDSLLATKLESYIASGWVRYAQPDYIYTIDAPTPAVIVPASAASVPAPRSHRRLKAAKQYRIPAASRRPWIDP
jgi:hypothetical protein